MAHQGQAALRFARNNNPDTLIEVLEHTYGSLFQLNQRVIGLHRVHGLNVDRLYDTVPVRPYALFHFHGFHNANFVAGRHSVARADQYRNDPARHG